jgi:hypothetical protein
MRSQKEVVKVKVVRKPNIHTSPAVDTNSQQEVRAHSHSKEEQLMTQSSQTQAFCAPMQQVWSDSLSMVLEGVQASQAHAKKLLESGFEMATASAKDNVKYAEDVCNRLTEASNHVNGMLREQASLVCDLPNDPVGATQRVISGYVEGSRKSMELEAAALKSYVTLVSDAWGRLEKVSHDMRAEYVDYFGKLQGIIESKTNKA